MLATQALITTVAVMPSRKRPLRDTGHLLWNDQEAQHQGLSPDEKEKMRTSLEFINGEFNYNFTFSRQLSEMSFAFRPCTTAYKVQI